MEGLETEDLNFLMNALQKSRAPLLWLGNGLRRLPSEELRAIVRDISIPYLTSWSATDLFSPIEGLYVGHAGTYGGRAANLMLQLHLLVTIGTRLAILRRAIDKN